MRRWEDLSDELDRHGVAIVAISTDTPAEIRAGRAKHGSRAVLLSDPDLVVTDRFNLRNQRNFTPKGKRPMPIPTTVLVDAAGIVRWVDQATDYQVRSHPDRVRAALVAGLGGAATG